MRIAISTDGDFVSPHFGRCAAFTIADITNGTLVSRETIGNPGHDPGFLPKFLRDKGVECIIAGGMGQRAEILFRECGIRTLTGVSGRVDDGIEGFCKGTLEGGASLCSPGAGKGYGVEKTECDHASGHHDHH